MRTIRFLSIIVLLLMPLPALLTADLGTFVYHSPIVFLLYYTFILLISLVAFIMGKIVTRVKGKKRLVFFKSLAFFIGGVISGTILILGFIYCVNSISAFIYPLIALFFYWNGYMMSQRSSVELLSAYSLGGYLLTSVAAYIIYGALLNETGSFAYGQLIMIVSALVILLLSLYIFNQRNITILYTRRSSDNAEMPRSIRRYNSILVTVICGLILVLFLFCGPLSGILSAFLFTIAKVIVKAFCSIFSVELEADEEAAIDFNPDNSEETVIYGTNVGVTALYFVTIVFTVVFLFFTIRTVIRFIRRKLYAKPSVSKNTEEGYTDYLSYEPVRDKERDNGFRASVRAYRREKDIEKKYRLGYRAFMVWLTEHGYEPFFSDTTETHLNEVHSAISGLTLSDDIINDYNQLRYNDGAITKDAAKKMQQFLKKLERKNRS